MLEEDRTDDQFVMNPRRPTLRLHVVRMLPPRRPFIPPPGADEERPFGEDAP